MTRDEANAWILSRGWLVEALRVGLTFAPTSAAVLPPGIWRTCVVTAKDWRGWYTLGWLPENPWKEVGR